MSVDKFEVLKKLVGLDNYLDAMTKSVVHARQQPNLDKKVELKIKFAKKTLKSLYDFVETNTFDTRFRQEKYKRAFVNNHTAFKLEGGADMYAIIDDKHTIDACDGAVTMPTKDFIKSQVGARQ